MNIKYDVIIIGGGLAGHCLARQLILQAPNLSILILERNKYPAPESAHKVGESTVELGSHYLKIVLGLEDHLNECHLPKAGLRFFFSNGSNQEISQRFEMGSSDFPPAPSFQLDRGRLENFLHEDNIRLGITILDQCKVEDFEYSGSYLVKARRNGEALVFKGVWLVDASGRFSLVKRKNNLQLKNQHNANACWFRINAKIDIDEWFGSASRKEVPNGLRYYSTNHLLGEGYWVWIIPLASGSTSIGIVADNTLHPYTSINSFDSALRWLAKHEPQCADVVENNQSKLQDFHALRNYSYDCKQVFSKDRWALTGEAGLFLDPFYSPGTDFIAISNTMIVEHIIRDFSGNNIELLTKQHQQLYSQMYNSALNIYQDMYPIMGNKELMIRKIIWDYATYWGVTALIYTHGKTCDHDFIRENRVSLQQIDAINSKIQNRFSQQHRLKSNKYDNCDYLDTLKIPELGSWQAELLAGFDELSLNKKIKENVSRLKEMARVMFS